MVEAIGVSDRQAMRRVLIDPELASGYEGGGPASGKFERGGGIAVALNNERGEGNDAQVRAKIGSGEHAVKFQEHLHGALKKHVGPPLHHFSRDSIFGCAEKGRRGTGDDVRTVLAEGLASFLQSGTVDPGGIVRCFYGDRSDGGNHHDASNATAPVSREVADQFTATHGMCNDRGSLQIKLLHHSAEIVGQGVEFVASRGFDGTAMSAVVIGNATQPVRG